MKEEEIDAAFEEQANDIHESLEYAIAKKVWDDIFNNDTLIYDTFEDYFLNEIYSKQEKDEGKN